MEHRAKAIPEQFNVLLLFMERHGDLGKVQSGLPGRIRADGLWSDLTDILNNVSGGVKKPTDKWKKVWADWKTKTKKKVIILNRRADWIVGGVASKLNTLELRVLALMGLKGLPVSVGKVEAEEVSFDDTPPDSNHVVENEATDEIIINFLDEHSYQVPSLMTIQSEEILPCPPSPVQSPQPPPTPTPVEKSQVASAPRAISRRRLPRHARRPTPNACCLHRRKLLRQNRTQTPPEGASSEPTALELRRLRLEEERDRRHHERELERMRLESRRIQVEENHNLIFNRVADILQRFLSK